MWGYEGVHCGEEVRVVSGGKANGEDWKVDAAEGQVVRLEMAGGTDLVSLHSLQTRREHTAKPNKS